MTEYKIDVMDGGGQIIRRFNARCIDDREACALARRLLDVDGQADVWAGARRVGRVSVTSAAEIEMLAREVHKGWPSDRDDVRFRSSKAEVRPSSRS